MRIEHTAMYAEDFESARVFFEKYFDAKSNDGYHNPKTVFALTFCRLTMEQGKYYFKEA